MTTSGSVSSYARGDVVLDDPIKQAENQIAADVASPVAQGVAEIAALVPGLTSVLGVAVQRWIERRRYENQAYLIEVLKSELVRVRGRLAELMQKHPEFWRDDFILLLLDGLKKAENVRAKERIERIAMILAHAAVTGPFQSADCTEEMMRMAMDLDDRDVEILREVYEASIADRQIIVDGHPLESSDVPRSSAASVLAKLQSFGLIIDEITDRWEITRSKTPFGILQKGRDFVTYIQGAAAPP